MSGEFATCQFGCKLNNISHNPFPVSSGPKLCELHGAGGEGEQWPCLFRRVRAATCAAPASDRTAGLPRPLPAAAPTRGPRRFSGLPAGRQPGRGPHYCVLCGFPWSPCSPTSLPSFSPASPGTWTVGSSQVPAGDSFLYTIPSASAPLIEP